MKYIGNDIYLKLMRRYDYLKRVSHTSKFRYPFKSAISINVETESRLDFLLKQFSNQLLFKSADLYCHYELLETAK